MKIYFAPLEGITGYVYRNAYHKSFTDAEKYFLPFVIPHTKRAFSSKEKNDLLPANNEGMYAVPQVMTKSAEDFLLLEKELKDLGYHELNINAGCPSGTVVAKKRGAGLLDDTYALNEFLDGIFSKTNAKISIKTRIGMYDPDEFKDILEIYNHYPFHEVIVHPRVRKDFYKNKPDLETFEYALEHSENSIVYNGDLNSVEDMEIFKKRFPDVDTVMIGRGILRNPGLIDEIHGKAPADLKKIKTFHDNLLAGYEEAMGGGPNVLFKMKEAWVYLGEHIQGSEKYLKKIKKVKNVKEYQAIAEELFRNCRL